MTAMLRRTLPVILVLLAATPAWAGMPSFTLGDAAVLRLETISFFLLVLALCVVAVRLLWNRLCPVFPRWPRIGWKGAAGIVLAWSLLALLILTMISGARELMTPGAWEKRGATYRLAGSGPAEEPLAGLRTWLMGYADRHDGAFPPHDLEPSIPSAAWLSGHASGSRLRYLPGQRRTASATAAVPLAWQPPAHGPERMVLFTDGSIRPVPIEALLRQAAAAASAAGRR